MQIIGDVRSALRGSAGKSRTTARVLVVVVSAVVLAAGVLTASAAVAASSPTLSASPNTGLSNGSVVSVSGSGFAKSSIGNVLECNSDPSQPTVEDGSPINSSIPVSCTAPSYSKLVTTNGSGDVSTTYTVEEGTTGPPCGASPAAVTCPSTDSAGHTPTADAADYPCPPTPAQEAAGDTCELTYGDQSGDSANAVILFAGESPPPTTTTAPPVTFHITTTSLPAATVGVAYSVQVYATGGTAPYKWKRIAGSLPKGLKLHSNGLLSGTPKTKDVLEPYAFTARAQTHKSKGNPKLTATQGLTLTLN
jgi:large repetitive protein